MMSSSSSDEDAQHGYAESNRRMFESDMESLAESLESIEPPPVVIEGRARSMTIEQTPRHPCSKPRFPPRSTFLMDMEPKPPKPLKRPAEVTEKSPKKRKLDPEAEAKRQDLIRRKKEEREQAKRKREEAEAKRNEVLKRKKAERDEAERKREEALARTKEAERKAAREKDQKEKMMRDRKRKEKEMEVKEKEVDAEDTPSESASTSSAGANSVEVRDGRILFALSTKDFGNKIVKNLIKQQEKERAQASLNPVQKAKGIGIRVENLQGKNVKHWCPVCRVICPNLKTHLNSPPAASREAHAEVDEQKVYDYCTAIYSRGLRGPVDTTQVADELVALEGDKDKVKKYVDNLLSAFGVGVSRNDSTSYVPIYNMKEVFNKDKEPQRDLQLELENEVDQMIEEGE